MNILDIILLVPLVWAVWSGFRNGIVVQLGSIAGLLIGVWLAFRYGAGLGEALNLNSSFDNVIGFIIILLATMIAMGVIGRLLKGLFRFAGLAALDHVGGAVLALCKIGLVLGLLLYGFNILNGKQRWIDGGKMETSLLYKPLTGAAQLIFPYVDLLKEKLLFDEEQNEPPRDEPAGDEEDAPETTGTGS